MGKISNKRKRALKNIKGHALDDDTYLDKENADQIDAFHKQREMIPLDVNKDIKVSDDDVKEPIFGLEASQDGNHCNDSEDDDEDFTDAKDDGFSRNIVLKYLKERFGGVEEDEISDDDEKNNLWGRNKNLYYGADNTDYEKLQSSDEDLLMEEREVMKIEKEGAKTLVKSDFGLECSDEAARNSKLVLKYLKERLGGVEEDEISDDDEKNNLWGINKNLYYGADNTDYEKLQSSDEDLLMEEREVMKIEKERAKTLVKSDFGLESSDEGARNSKRAKFLQMLLRRKKAIKIHAVPKKDRKVHRSVQNPPSFSVPQSSGKLAPTARTTKNGLKIISGNKDAPKRDDSAKRFRKHEPRKHEPRKHEPRKHEPRKHDNLQRKNEKLESADKSCSEVKKQRTQKVEIFENVYTRPFYGPEDHVSYVRQPVCREIMENRGLTRYRKKLTKNPRKKYKIKHEKAMMRRKGQVRDIRRPTGPYGGEPSGINIHVSRSIRLD